MQAKADIMEIDHILPAVWRSQRVKQNIMTGGKNHENYLHR